MDNSKIEFLIKIIITITEMTEIRLITIKV